MGINFGSLLSSAVSGLGSIATTALHDLAPAVSKEATSLFNGVVGDTFQGITSLGQNFISGTSLPSPIKNLASSLLGSGSSALQSLATSAGDKAIANLFGQGSTVGGVQVPAVIGTGSRNAAATTSAISTVAQSFLAPTTGSSSAAATSSAGPLSQAVDMSGMLSTGNSAQENQLLSGISDPAQKAQMQFQITMQHQQEVAEFVSNILKMLHSTQEALIGNLRG
jgi:hypothetical protein